MFFDTLSGIAERHLPEFVPVLRRARLFRLERESPRSSGEVVDTWHPDERVIENFRLPFDAVAVEYAPSRGSPSDACVAFWPMGPPEQRLRFLVGQGGRSETIIGAGVLTALPDTETLGPGYGHIAALHEMRLWTGTKKSGLERVPCRLEWVDRDYDKLDRLARGNAFERMLSRHARDDMTQAALVSELGRLDAHVGKVTEDIHRLYANMAFGRCAIGVLALMLISEPAAFIVEERPLAPPRDHPNHSIPRSAGRPHYIVLKPRQIRERFLYPNGVPEEDGPEDAKKRRVTPHERRGHYRRLQADRFKAARGQVLWIKPMWVGPSEAVNGVNRYTVRLDL